MATTACAPLVRSRIPGAIYWRLYLNPLGYLTWIAAEYGDIVRLKTGNVETLFINSPDLVRDVLTTHDRKFSKGEGLQVASRLMGKGLLTSEGAFHLRQRRLVQPAFHRQRVAAYAQAMVACTGQAERTWENGSHLDIAREMQKLTLAIAGRTLFGEDMEAETREITEAFGQILRLYNLAVLPFSDRLERFFSGLTRRFRTERGRLDAVIYRIINERRSTAAPRDDLLSLLLSARDEDDDAIQMTDEQVRDEAMTLLLAGHETTANALAWTWFLLSQNPAVDARLQAEVDTVIGDRIPTSEDTAALPYTRMVFAESMRLYPPAWALERRAIEDVPLGDYVVPAGQQVLFSQWVMHRDARFYPDPTRFDPDRWTPEALASRPRFSYFPFGGGSRLCVGEHFAWTEGILVIAYLARRWRFRPGKGRRVVPQPLITLRPRPGIPIIAERRAAHSPHDRANGLA